MVPKRPSDTERIYDCRSGEEHNRHVRAVLMFDLNSKVQVNAVCTRVRHYEDGEYRVTETEYYNAYRDINLDYLKIPVDASEK